MESVSEDDREIMMRIWKKDVKIKKISENFSDIISRLGLKKEEAMKENSHFGHVRS